MSDWIHVTGYMVIGNDLPCHIGKYGKPFDEEISDEEFIRMWVGEICGETVSDMLGKIIIAMSKKWKYFVDKPHNPFGFHDRILWKRPIYDGEKIFVEDEEEEEWFRWDEQKLKDKSLLECLQFLCGSEGPLNVTVTPHIDEWGTCWHVVFDGNLRDRDSSYFEHAKSWWEAMQTMFNVCSGYICCTWLDNKWENII